MKCIHLVLGYLSLEIIIIQNIPIRLFKHKPTNDPLWIIVFNMLFTLTSLKVYSGNTNCLTMYLFAY